MSTPVERWFTLGVEHVGIKLPWKKSLTMKEVADALKSKPTPKLIRKLMKRFDDALIVLTNLETRPFDYPYEGRLRGMHNKVVPYLKEFASFYVDLLRNVNYSTRKEILKLVAQHPRAKFFKDIDTNDEALLQERIEEYIGMRRMERETQSFGDKWYLKVEDHQPLWNQYAGYSFDY